MHKQRRRRGTGGRRELRLTRTERLIVIGWVLGVAILLYLIIPWNARRAVEHAQAHAGGRPSQTVGAPPEGQKTTKR
jgi:hypothetical protein